MGASYASFHLLRSNYWSKQKGGCFPDGQRRPQTTALLPVKGDNGYPVLFCVEDLFVIKIVNRSSSKDLLVSVHTLLPSFFPNFLDFPKLGWKARLMIHAMSKKVSKFLLE
jgi:hypothetical protein